MYAITTCRGILCSLLICTERYLFRFIFILSVVALLIDICPAAHIIIFISVIFIYTFACSQHICAGAIICNFVSIILLASESST